MTKNVEISFTNYSISTRFTVKSRTFTVYGVVNDSILDVSLDIIRQRLKLRQVPNHFSAQFKLVIEIINCGFSLRSLLDQVAQTIAESDLIRCIASFEEAISIRGLSANYSRGISRIFQDIILASNSTLLEGRTIELVASRYVSNFAEPKISPVAMTGDLAAMPHRTVKDLHDDSIRYLKDENNRYLDAAQTVIEEHLRIFTELERLRDYPLSTHLMEDFDSRLEKQDPWRTNPYSRDELMALTLRRILSSPQMIDFALPGKSSLPNLAQYPYLRAAKSFAPYWLSILFLPSAALVAIATVIAIKTGWNTNSVCNLKFSDIQEINSSRFLLQGDKRKTDDRTPMVDVHKSDELFFSALKLLRWHFQSVTSLNLYDGEMVFVAKSRDVKTLLHSHLNPFATSYFTKHMVKRFNLKKVIPKDFRDNVASLRWLETNDIHRVRELLGHNSISTTHEYLKSGIISSLNQSKILEFQRRIEATIIFIDRGDDGLHKAKLDNRHVDLRLIPLTRLGDGTRCADPNNSPLKFERRNQCSGMFCHDGDGCPNNQITIDRYDIELLERTIIYYRARWQVLYSQNPDLFKKVHLTKLMFIRALLSVVQRQRPDLILTRTEI